MPGQRRSLIGQKWFDVRQPHRMGVATGAQRGGERNTSARAQLGYVVTYPMVEALSDYRDRLMDDEAIRLGANARRAEGQA